MLGLSKKERELRRLKQRAEFLSQFYIKGFTGVLQEISGSYYAWSHYYDRLKNPREHYKKRVESACNTLEDCYSEDNINLSGLEYDEDFAPLFMARLLIPKLLKTVRRNLEGNVEEFDEISVRHLLMRTKRVGNIYWGTYFGLIHKIWEISGKKDYWIPLVDVRGKVWGKSGKVEN